MENNIGIRNSLDDFTENENCKGMNQWTWRSANRNDQILTEKKNIEKTDFGNLWASTKISSESQRRERIWKERTF